VRSATPLAPNPAGSGGTTLVTLQGVACDSHGWDRVGLENLPLGVTAVRHVEYPGHGTRPSHPGWRLNDLADEIAATEAAKFHVVAVAAGVSVAAQLLARHPERVESLVMACGVFEEAVSPAFVATATRLATDKGALADDEFLNRYLARWLGTSTVEDDWCTRYLRERLLAIDASAWSDCWLALAHRTPVSLDDIDASDIPVTIVVASGDTTRRPEEAIELHRRIGRSRLVFVPGPHMLALKRPRNVAMVVDQHFQWLDQGAPRVERSIYQEVPE
jgi:pimeloyl-ACP methyl ester carboxylesterase